MKILVCSDSHGELEFMRRAIERERPDRVLHLGDVSADAHSIQREYPDLPMELVRGNCDGWETTEPVERELFLGGKRIWMLHGHTWQVKMGQSLVVFEARTRGMDVVLFGHTHKPLCYLDGSLWVMNPGTISGWPRATYGVMELENGAVSCRTAVLE